MAGSRFLLISSLLLAGCRAGPPSAPAQTIPEPPEAARSWQEVAQPRDIERLEALAGMWDAALAAAEAAGLGRAVEAEGALVDPEAGLPRAMLPPGSYRCRILRFSSPGGRRRAFIAYPAYFCHVGVEQEFLSFTKQTGSERPGGYIWPDTDVRQIFLGAMAVEDEAVPPAYGADAERDLIGIVERVGPFRYRIVFPAPSDASALDVLDLVPVAPDMD